MMIESERGNEMQKSEIVSKIVYMVVIHRRGVR